MDDSVCEKMFIKDFVIIIVSCFESIKYTESTGVIMKKGKVLC